MFSQESSGSYILSLIISVRILVVVASTSEESQHLFPEILKPLSYGSKD